MGYYSTTTTQTPRTHGSKRLGPPASADLFSILFRFCSGFSHTSSKTRVCDRKLISVPLAEIPQIVLQQRSIRYMDNGTLAITTMPVTALDSFA